MFHIKLSQEFIVSEKGTSDGTQIKYYKAGYWYKTDMLGNEGEVEYLCSGILPFSSLKKKEYVRYEMGTINGKEGCRSKNFINKGDTFITFNRLHKNITGMDMHKKISEMNGLENMVEYVQYFIKSVCNIDITEYLRKIFTLDFIILNEDRHFNNLGVILKENGTFMAAPIFDNGKSLLNGNYSMKKNLPIEENVKRVIAKPFGGTHKKIFEFMGKGFDLDVEQAVQWLNSQKQSYSRNVLLYQLHTNKDLFGEKPQRENP